MLTKEAKYLRTADWSGFERAARRGKVLWGASHHHPNLNIQWPEYNGLVDIVLRDEQMSIHIYVYMHIYGGSIEPAQ